MRLALRGTRKATHPFSSDQRADQGRSGTWWSLRNATVCEATTEPTGRSAARRCLSAQFTAAMYSDSINRRPSASHVQGGKIALGAN